MGTSTRRIVRTERATPEAPQPDSFNLDTLRRLSAWKNEPAWMLARREAAWQIYQDIPMPQPTDEEWRRTDIRPLRLNQIVPFRAETSLPQDSLSHLPNWLGRRAVLAAEQDGLLIHRDASVSLRQVSDTLAKRGVIFTDMDTAVREHADLVQRYFMTEAVKPTASKFAALHAAFWTGGTFVYVPKNVEVELPLYTLTYLSGAERSNFGHVLVVADEGSAVTVVDQQASPTTPDAPQSLHVGAVELIVRDAALVRHMWVQDWGRNVWNFSTQRAILGRDSVLQWYIGALGAHLTKANLELTLTGPGGRGEFIGMMFLDKEQHMDHKTYQNHESKLTGSDLLFLAALRDSARAVYQGLIRIHPGAQRSDAYQQDRNLILGRDARADSIPGLEIEADDVRCTHGATAGPVEEEYIFYLMTRGLSRHEAERVVVDGFFEEVLRRFPVEPVRERLQAAVAQKFEAA